MSKDLDSEEFSVADLPAFCESHEDLNPSMPEHLSKILANVKTIKGPTTRYILESTKIAEGKLLKKERIGEVNETKPQKVILLVGETGTGKTNLINAMVNYTMGVRWQNKIWMEVVEISDDQSKSQTSVVTVYEVFPQDRPFSLKIIDTPGFGEARGEDNDAEGEDNDPQIAEALQKLFRSEDGIHEIDAVCLVLKATDSRLHDRQMYILDEVLSLFGKDIEKHFLMLITCTNEAVPKRALNLIKESKIPCAKKNGQPVYFTFDNCQSERFDEENRENYKSSWDHGIENFNQFFDYLNGLHPKSLDMTEGVLRTRKQLAACVYNLNERIEWAELIKTECEQTEAAVKEYEKNPKRFQYEVDEPFKDLVKVESTWWHFSKQATRCTKCKENCHYPGCWWVKDISWCSVMSKEGKCTVCTGKCEHTYHVKDDTKYMNKTRKVTKTDEDLKRKYEQYAENKSLMISLKSKIEEIKEEKIRLVEECYQCLEKLMETSLKSTSLSCFIHLDFMIEKVKETGKQERVQKLKELKKKAEEENAGLIKSTWKYVKHLYK